MLVVDDHPVNRLLAKHAFERGGCTVDLAVNGREAVQRCGQTAYHLVVMDCQMPVMDGYEACIEIRKREDAGRRVPIVALTAFGSDENREQCLAAGMDEFLVKPVTAEELLRLLERWSSRAPVDLPVAPAPPVAPEADAVQPASFDAPGLRRKLADDAGLFEELLGLLESTAPKLLHQIRSGLPAHDFEQIRMASHTVAGAVGNFNASTAYTEARRLEKAAKERMAGECDAAAPDLESAMTELLQDLRAYVKVAARTWGPS